MLLAEEGHPTLQVGSPVTDNCTRHTGSLRSSLKLLANDLAARLLHRFQHQYLQIVVLQRSTIAGPRIKTTADNQQTFDRTDLNGVVDNPHPIMGLFFGTRQFIKTEPEDPQPTGIGTRNRKLLAEKTSQNLLQGSMDAPLAGHTTQEQLHK